MPTRTIGRCQSDGPPWPRQPSGRQPKLVGPHPPMKILYHHRTQAADGQYVHISELTHALESLGHEIVMVGPGGNEKRRMDAGAGSGLRERLPAWLYELLEFGYSGLAYANDEVKMPCVSKGKGKCVAPTVETAIDRSYPIARPLFMYTNGEPTGTTKEYLDWILSDAGQCIIQKKGYAPVKAVTCS